MMGNAKCDRLENLGPRSTLFRCKVYPFRLQSLPLSVARLSPNCLLDRRLLLVWKSSYIYVFIRSNENSLASRPAGSFKCTNQLTETNSARMTGGCESGWRIPRRCGDDVTMARSHSSRRRKTVMGNDSGETGGSV